jgi:hypothetical protein
MEIGLNGISQEKRIRNFIKVWKINFLLLMLMKMIYLILGLRILIKIYGIKLY